MTTLSQEIILLRTMTLTNKQIKIMKTYIPQQIIVPVYYFIDEDEKVQFDFEEMTRFFENELSNICSTDKQIN